MLLFSRHLTVVHVKCTCFWPILVFGAYNLQRQSPNLILFAQSLFLRQRLFPKRLVKRRRLVPLNVLITLQFHHLFLAIFFDIYYNS